MRLQRIFRLGALTTAAAVVAGVAGCGVQYNGALGPLDSNAPTTSAQANATPGTPGTPGTTGTTAGTAATPAPSVHPAQSVIASPADASLARYAANTAPDTMRPLGLFGQLPQSVVGVSSPLDSSGNVKRVTFATEGADFDPDIDPTGQWIAYASTQHRTTADIYIKRVDGTAVTQITNDPGNDVMPAFSPDGRSIAFASDRSGNWDIYITDINGGQAVQITNDPTHDLHPSFSPDGKRLVYCSYGAQSGQWELVVIDLQRPATKRFVGFGLNPKWSPTGDKILFQRARERGTRWFSVWTIDLIDGEGVRPTEVAASANAAVITPSWSPDGKHIVFCTVVDPAADEFTRPSQADIWICAADGSNRMNLTYSSKFTNLQPAWSADGVIYFVSNRSKDATENIYAIRPDRALSTAQQASTGGSRPAQAAQPTATQPDAARSASVPTGVE